MTDDSVIEEAMKAVNVAKEAIWRTSPDFDGETNLIAALDKMLAVFEKAHAPTDDEGKALLELVNRLLWMYDQEQITVRYFTQALQEAGYRRRSEVPEPQGEPSDAQVIAALNAMMPYAKTDDMDDWNIETIERMRAALRAAGGVR